MKKLIRNVKIVTPYDLIHGHALLVENGRILDILDEENINNDDFHDIIDGEGNYLSPGFIDIHNHGNSGFDIMDSSEEALDTIGKYHISNGVTSYLGTVITSSQSDMLKAIKNIAHYRNRDDASQIIGIHLEGPFFNTIKKGAQPEGHIKNPNIRATDEIINESNKLLKMVSLAPELEGSLEVIEYLRENNIAISMAHSNATYEEAKIGINHGISIATHLFNGMREFSHREPGIIGASLTDDRVYCEIIYDRFHLHDIAVKIGLGMKGYDKIVLVSDAMMAAGLDDGEYILGGQKVFVKDGKPRLETGSIAGSTLDLQTAVYNLVNYLQVPLNEAVKMASLNPAKAIRMDSEIGSIDLGKKADLIIFDRDINIKKVFLKGVLAWKGN